MKVIEALRAWAITQAMDQYAQPNICSCCGGWACDWPLYTMVYRDLNDEMWCGNDEYMPQH